MTRKIFIISTISFVLVSVLLLSLYLIYQPLINDNNKDTSVKNFEFVEAEYKNNNLSFAKYLSNGVNEDTKIYQISGKNITIEQKIFYSDPLVKYYLIQSDDENQSNYFISKNQRNNIFANTWYLVYPVKSINTEYSFSEIQALNKKDFEEFYKNTNSLQTPEQINQLVNNYKINPENDENNVRRRVTIIPPGGQEYFKNLFVNENSPRDWKAMRKWLDEKYPETETESK